VSTPPVPGPSLLALIHRSAWKGNSPKFAETLPVTLSVSPPLVVPVFLSEVPFQVKRSSGTAATVYAYKYQLV
jgi:hypothetical protein